MATLIIDPLGCSVWILIDVLKLPFVDELVSLYLATHDLPRIDTLWQAHASAHLLQQVSLNNLYIRQFL